MLLSMFLCKQVGKSFIEDQLATHFGVRCSPTLYINKFGKVCWSICVLSLQMRTLSWTARFSIGRITSTPSSIWARTAWRCDASAPRRNWRRRLRPSRRNWSNIAKKLRGSKRKRYFSSLIDLPIYPHCMMNAYSQPHIWRICGV